MNGTFYTEAEITWMRENRTQYVISEFTALFNSRFRHNKSVKALHGTCKRYGITTGRSGQFGKGHMPHNKMKFGMHYSPGTEFKKGHLPHNHVPIGTEIIVDDHYTKVKTAEPNVWRRKHIINWEQHHGKTKPKGYAIIFLDNDRQNCDVDNLLLISRGALVIHNKRGWSQQPPEIRRTLIAMCEIEVKANRLAKQKMDTTSQEASPQPLLLETK